MTDYKKLVNALRCELNGVPCHDENCEWLWHGGGCCDEVRMMVDSAAAIEVLQDKFKELGELLDEASEAADVSEMRAEELQAEVDALQAEVERLKDSNEELREKQTYIDHYGDTWMTSAKDVPTAAYEHGYLDGWDEAMAKMEVQE